MLKDKRVWRFKKGDITSLDSIYEINGLWNSDWWEPVNDMNSVGGSAEGEAATHSSGETVMITRNIEIEIKRK